MSGMGGWSGARDRGYSDDRDHSDSTFDDSRDAYKQPARPWSGAMSGDPDRGRGGLDRNQSMRAPNPDTLHTPNRHTGYNNPQPAHSVDLRPGRKLKSTARNVLIILLDMTGSFGDWPHEVISRGEGMLDLMAKYTGTDDNQILIIGFGDGPRYDDRPLMVAPDFGSDQKLADYLGALEHQLGGANGYESSQLGLQHVLRMVDTRTASNVWTVVVTDEEPYMQTKEQEVDTYFPGTSGEYPLGTKECVEILRNKSSVFCVFGEGADLGMPHYDRESFKKTWQDLLGVECVIPIEFKERLVDTMLLVVANSVGQGAQFMTDFINRQKAAGTRFADVNIKSMHRSIQVAQSGTGSKAIVAPQKTRKSIIDL